MMKVGSTAFVARIGTHEIEKAPDVLLIANGTGFALDGRRMAVGAKGRSMALLDRAEGHSLVVVAEVLRFAG